MKIEHQNAQHQNQPRSPELNDQNHNDLDFLDGFKHAPDLVNFFGRLFDDFFDLLDLFAFALEFGHFKSSY